MKNGYYWVKCGDEETEEIVEYTDGNLYRCGSEITIFPKGDQWIEFGMDLEIIFLEGPLSCGGSR